MSDISEKRQAKWILIVRETREYLTFHNIDIEPPCGEPNLLEWIDWRTQATDDEGNLLWDDEEETIPVMIGKELPEDIDSAEYKLIDNNLVKEG